MSYHPPRSVRRGFLLTFPLICFAIVALVWGATHSSEAVFQTPDDSTASVNQSRNEPAALARFREEVGGDVTPVLVELKGDPGAVRKYAAEQKDAG